MFDGHLPQDQVIGRKDVQPSQAEDQEHFGSPFADAFDGGDSIVLLFMKELSTLGCSCEFFSGYHGFVETVGDG